MLHAGASIEDEVYAVKAASEVMLKLQPGPPGGNTVLYTGSGAAGEVLDSTRLGMKKRANKPILNRNLRPFPDVSLARSLWQQQIPDRNLKRRKEQLQLHGPSLVPDLASGCATLQRGGGPAGGTKTEPGTISLHQPRGGDGRWNHLSVGDPKIMLNTRNSLKESRVTKVRAALGNISTGGKSLFML